MGVARWRCYCTDGWKGRKLKSFKFLPPLPEPILLISSLSFLRYFSSLSFLFLWLSEWLALPRKEEEAPKERGRKNLHLTFRAATKRDKKNRWALEKLFSKNTGRRRSAQKRPILWTNSAFSVFVKHIVRSSMFGNSRAINSKFSNNWAQARQAEDFCWTVFGKNRKKVCLLDSSFLQNQYKLKKLLIL